MRIHVDTSTLSASKLRDDNNEITRALKNIAQGASSLGEVEFGPNMDNPDAVFLFGSCSKRKENAKAKVIQEHRKRGHKVFHLDTGLFSTYIRQHYDTLQTNMFRIGLHDCTGEGEWLNDDVDGKRFEWFRESFSVTPKEPRADNTAPIMFILQHEKGWQYDETIPHFEWARGVLKHIRSITDREIIIRNHPIGDTDIDRVCEGFTNISMQRPGHRKGLLKSLESVGAVVTHSSSSACESIVEGIPTFALSPRCIAREACPSDLNLLNNLEDYDWSNREQSMNKWAYTSWHLDELKTPEVISYYLRKAKINE